MTEVEVDNNMKFLTHSTIENVHIPRLNIDPVRSHHRPLIYYTFTGLFDYGSDYILHAQGFRRYSIGIVNYWVAQGSHSSDSNDEPPIVFVHGVGIGLVTYLPFILKLWNRKSHRDIMLVELPHVSMKLRLHPEEVPTMQVLVEAIRQAMTKHKFKPAHWVAHSLGTVYLLYFVQ